MMRGTCVGHATCPRTCHQTRGFACDGTWAMPWAIDGPTDQRGRRLFRAPCPVPATVELSFDVLLAEPNGLESLTCGPRGRTCGPRASPMPHGMRCVSWHILCPMTCPMACLSLSPHLMYTFETVRLMEVSRGWNKKSQNLTGQEQTNHKCPCHAGPSCPETTRAEPCGVDPSQAELGRAGAEPSRA